MHPEGVLLKIFGMWHQQYIAGTGNMRHAAVKGLILINNNTHYYQKNLT